MARAACAAAVHAARNGLIRRDALPGVPLYDRKLSLAEVRHRIDAYYLPYRRALAGIAALLHAAHRALWHIDCH